MKTFFRTVGYVNICISVEEMLYYNNKVFFDEVLDTFVITNDNHCSNTIYIFDHNSLLIKQLYQEHRLSGLDESYKTHFVTCDTSDSHWMSFLMCDLEEIFINVLKCTTLHGAGIDIQDKKILILGERRSGKTTLVRDILNTYKCKYLDDDCVFIFDGAYYGFNRPLPIRSNEHSLELYQNNIGVTLDGENELRILIPTKSKAISFDDIDVVIFPKYVSSDIKKNSYIKELDTSAFYNCLISNVRFSKDTKQLFFDIMKIVKNAMGYYLEYDSSVTALKLINKLLFEKTSKM